MGDRVLFQVVSKNDGFSPVVYGHWSGSDAKKVVARLQTRMRNRPGDVAHAAARLVQELVGDTKGDTGFGVWNTDHVLTEADSHGDAGIALLDADNGYAPQYLGGYLRSDV